MATVFIKLLYWPNDLVSAKFSPGIAGFFAHNPLVTSHGFVSVEVFPSPRP